MRTHSATLLRSALRTIALLALVGSVALAQGDPETLFRLPGATATVSGDAITVSYRGAEDVYVAGLGWLSGSEEPPPVVAGSDVLVTGATLESLGVTAPRPEAMRPSGDAEVRIVLDLLALDPASLAGLAGRGSVEEGEALVTSVPPLVLAAVQPEELAGVELGLGSSESATNVRIVGPAFTYGRFVLSDPTRVVLDVTPRRTLDQPEVTRDLASGVEYRRFNYTTAGGGSVVHVV